LPVVFLAAQYFQCESGSFHRFVEIKNKGEWAKVSVTRGQLSLITGEPTWGEIDRMKLTIWFPANTSANNILIDEAVWDSQEERLALNKNWYDWHRPDQLNN
jgi:hypothetical protein